MRPASGRWTPARTFIRVDLPAPFSPTTASTSPGETESDTPSSACTPGKCLLMFSAWRKGVDTGRSGRGQLLAEQLVELLAERAHGEALQAVLVPRLLLDHPEGDIVHRVLGL